MQSPSTVTTLTTWPTRSPLGLKSGPIAPPSNGPLRTSRGSRAGGGLPSKGGTCLGQLGCRDLRLMSRLLLRIISIRGPWSSIGLRFRLRRVSVDLLARCLLIPTIVDPWLALRWFTLSLSLSRIKDVWSWEVCWVWFVLWFQVQGARYWNRV